MTHPDAPLSELRRHFLATSTVSMPLAGLIVWTAIGVAALFLPQALIGWFAIYAMAIILPLAFLLDRLRGRALFQGQENPVTKLFLASIAGIGIMFPLVIGASLAAHDPNIMVLGVAILAGVIWIQYGWGADDPVGLRHAIARAIGCYLAYWFVPPPYKASAICFVVALAYLYSLAAMRKPGA